MSAIETAREEGTEDGKDIKKKQRAEYLDPNNAKSPVTKAYHRAFQEARMSIGGKRHRKTRRRRSTRKRK